MTASIVQTVHIGATPERVLEALTNGDQFGAATGAPAQIGREPGAAFSLFGGAITGRQIEHVDGRRLVQAWRVVAWPEGSYSLVHFELHAEGAGTTVHFRHDGFPDEQREHLDAGWHARYWDPLKAFFKQSV